MGIYLNPGSAAFEEAVCSPIYVDKTELVMAMNAVVRTEQKYVSVLRPRRFGKTMAAKMLCTYYGRGAEARKLFESRALASCEPVMVGPHEVAWDTYLGAFDVVHVTMTDFLGRGDASAAMQGLTEEVTGELMEAFPEVSFGSHVSLRSVMARIHASTGRQFVIVIDEWDAIIRECQQDTAGQRAYLELLRDWLKDRDYVALAYITGILPIKKYGVHSALNMFTEHSMIRPMQLAPFMGFTSDEVRRECEARGLDFAGFKTWYDGYRLSSAATAEASLAIEPTDEEPTCDDYEVYSPYSVVSAMLSRQFANYWNQSETYEALQRYIEWDLWGLAEDVALLMDGGRVAIGVDGYQNDMTTFNSKDDVLTMLVHLGYLGYDSHAGQVFIPNREVREVFVASTRTDDWRPVFRSLEVSQRLLEATWSADEKTVAELLEEAHDQAENKTYNDELALSYAIRLAYFSAQRYYTTIFELDSGKGYADVCYLPAPSHPEVPALLVELKHNTSVDTALGQIRRRDYPQRLEHYRGNLLLAGISYDAKARNDDPNYKHHTCKIERA